MGWIKQEPYLHPHIYCKQPDFRKDFGVGSVWQCDKCNRKWVVNSIDGNQMGGTYAVWSIFGPTVKCEG